MDVQIVRRWQREFAQLFVRPVQLVCAVNLSSQAFDADLPARGIPSFNRETVYEATHFALTSSVRQSVRRGRLSVSAERQCGVLTFAARDIRV